ncbi:uncharacterized protein LOC144634597 isoform X2 [Oculina patagonica]
MSCLYGLDLIEQPATSPGKGLCTTEQKMAFLNGRVSPEPLCPSTSEGETELSDSLPLGEKDKDHFNNNEGTETSIIDHRGANEYQEGLDGIPEEQLYNENSLFQNGKISPGNKSPKLNSWSNPEGNIPSGRYHACNRVVLLAVCFMSAASLLLTLLMLFGIVGPLHCACSGETDQNAPVISKASYAELTKNVNDLKENVSSLKEASISESQNTTELWLAIQKVANSVNSSVNEKLIDVRQEIVQLDQKVVNISKGKVQVLNCTRGLPGPPGPRGYNGTRGSSGPRGPRGYNGTQGFSGPAGPRGYNGTKGSSGPAGPRGYNGTQGRSGPSGQPGYNGTQGPPGSANLALCSYNKGTSTGQSAGLYARETVQITESVGNKFLGVNCGTNDAKVVRLSSSISGGKRTYTCTCKATLSTGDANMYCYIHYWECPT